ncbi:hypothetical protein ACFQ1E_01760 [Sphingomonas canadensis]|uniref:Uncharacterized protein n=1 Tax=Sphingomonas canadensis TaxID=1219257 RepID=A0ABW3H0T4_9SPHN|nr:hypothetical protein [Sphingomonas canadensis]MCW3835033.1 hypothetical protein [Sphingomonas canadensis]
MTAPAPAALAPPRFEAEATPIGVQSLVPGVVPITQADRLALRAAQPLAARKPQRPCDLGLFDLAARDQLELFAPLSAPTPAAPPDRPSSPAFPKESDR